MGFSRQEYWSGLLLPSPGDLPNSGIEPKSPTLWADSLPSETPGKSREWQFSSLVRLISFVWVCILICQWGSWTGHLQAQLCQLCQSAYLEFFCSEIQLPRMLWACAVLARNTWSCLALMLCKSAFCCGASAGLKNLGPLPSPSEPSCNWSVEHWCPAALSYQAWGTQLSIPRGKEASDQPQITHISKNREV